MTGVNTGEQNKRPSQGRSILDYSLIGCFVLILLMGVMVLDAFEYITVPGRGGAKADVVHNALEIGDDGSMSTDEIAELQKKVDDAKKLLAKKTDEVEKLVEKVEEEIKEEKKDEAEAAGEPVKVETPEEKKEEEVKVEKVVEAVVQKELGIDRFCGGCGYKAMNFSCQKRVEWMMDSYGISEDIAKESVINSCHWRLRH